MPWRVESTLSWVEWIIEFLADSEELEGHTVWGPGGNAQVFSVGEVEKKGKLLFLHNSVDQSSLLPNI